MELLKKEATSSGQMMSGETRRYCKILISFKMYVHRKLMINRAQIMVDIITLIRDEILKNVIVTVSINFI